MFESRFYQQGELELLHVRSATCEATFSVQGGQLLSYRQNGQPSLLWENSEAVYREGLAIRQGIPICWPWFGDLARNPDPSKTNSARFRIHPPMVGFVNRTGNWSKVSSTLQGRLSSSQSIALICR